MDKKWKLFLAALAAVILISGCGIEQAPITSESEGIWNHYFVYPLSWVLTFFADLFLGSYGSAIVMVTIIIRLLLLPLFLKQQKSTLAIKQLQPEMEALKNKFDLKKQEQMQQYQQEIMSLYKENGVNPMAGCLPIFIQMPILMAFYFAIVRTEEIANHSFLWMNLGEPDPWYITPLAAGIVMFLQTKMSITDTSSAQMKPLLYIMPVMMVIAGIALPSALSLYWFAGGIFMVFQSLLFAHQRKQMKEQESTQI
ncbi:membrane protein insertase YidC [Alteribacillus bidgolensis]|uniref:Membrane protein insertase YidC n=1 Tax=Alteribacillus bidgolensis TaxID=930129 RepID=A0A1G8N4Q6_9BACI|nr:membrane protein insertase YidC [Alteribacillus bidgolensis]SDI74540.1 protein translocase subunit yidC [Alteribacillus bidgolensis]